MSPTSRDGRTVGALVKFVTLAVVVALATTVLGLTIANAGSGETEIYQARFDDAAGLLPGDDVRIAGVVVGSVREIEIVDRRVAEVSFEVAQGQPIPASAGAAIYYKNLIGQRYLALIEGTGPTGAVLAPGDTIPIDRTRGPLNLTTLFNGFKPLFVALDPQQVNQLSFEIIEVLQGQGGTVTSLLARTSSLTNTIADRDEVIGEVIDNLNAVLATVNARDDQLDDLIVALQQLVSGLAEDREPIGEALVSVGELTEATAGLVEDARPALRADIVALGELTDNLNENEAKVEQTLLNLPVKLNTVSRAASYGGWFQFYLCGVTGSVGFGDLLPAQEIPAFTSASPRCGPDPDGVAGQDPDPLGGVPPTFPTDVNEAPESVDTERVGG